MPKPIRSAAILRGYAWWLLKENLEWTVDDYDERVPIVPFSDEPRFKVVGKPYIVYGYSEGASVSDHRCTTGMLSFSIRSKNESDINLVTRVLVEGFKREDLSAKDINRFSSDIDEYFNGITFMYTKAPYVEPGSPAEEDQDWEMGTVTITYEYIDEFGDDPNSEGIKLRDDVFSY